MIKSPLSNAIEDVRGQLDSFKEYAEEFSTLSTEAVRFLEKARDMLENADQARVSASMALDGLEETLGVASSSVLRDNLDKVDFTYDTNRNGALTNLYRYLGVSPVAKVAWPPDDTELQAELDEKYGAEGAI